MSDRNVRVRSESDVSDAVRTARELGAGVGLSATDAAHLATAVSEIALNQLRHAGGGVLRLHSTPEGVLVEARDTGPGIPDVRRALTDGYSTAGSLGLGLPGARRLMDEFEIESAPGQGVHVRMAKWTAPVRTPTDAGRLVSHGAAPGRLACVVEPWPAGVLLALVPPSAEPAVRADPSAPPHVIVERAGGREAVVASFSGLDGRLVWRAEAGGAGVLQRVRGERTAIVATAPRLRAQTLAVLRGDLLVLSSFSLAELPDGLPRSPAAAAARVAAAAPSGTRAPAVLAAVFARGSHERRTSAG